MYRTFSTSMCHQIWCVTVIWIRFRCCWICLHSWTITLNTWHFTMLDKVFVVIQGFYIGCAYHITNCLTQFRSIHSCVHPVMIHNHILKQLLIPSIKDNLSLFETVMSCECVVINTILYTAYSRSLYTLCLSRHHSTFNSSTVPIVLTKLEGLFQKCPVHSSAPVHILSFLPLSSISLQILLIVVWRKLWVFGLRGTPPLPLFRNDLEEGIYCSLL